MSNTEARDDWDRHWSEYGESYERNPAQEFRRRLITGLLTSPGPLVRVADIGSGQGEMLAALADRYPEAALLGLEYSAFGTQVGARRVPRGLFLQRDLMVEANPPEGYRAWATHAICSEVLEHVDQPEALLRHAAEFLAPGCRLVVTVPGGPMSAFDRHIGHRRHFTPDALRTVLAGAGFEVESAVGDGFPFFNLYRCVILLRGTSLVADISDERAQPSRTARAAMSAFKLLLRLPTVSTRGWQTVAVARLPDRGADG
ncbi:MAG: class I SAM-dependent methyltransferase [Candidatus Dormibacteraeota bacterium]|nr:class I SAM-dependent methyltransferase [Candidatus Dormibacteraeota bacterium]MBO0762047.1 class I SAM-dependent methyltransferase [Candidatus Dormibacteraeota bacterium]